MSQALTIEAPVPKTVLAPASSRTRTCIVLAKGQYHMLLPISQIVYFYTDEKVVYVRDNSGRKHLTDKHLSEWQTLLDPQCFFRANRQYLVHADFILGYRPCEKVKLQLLLQAGYDDTIIISSQNARSFKEWLHNL